MDVDLVRVADRLAAAEAAVHDTARHDQLVRELDRLAEHLIGQNSVETLHFKVRIQRLIAVVAQNRTGVTVYLQAYCHITEL